jgi:NAD(P)-dependent dehydrogenase (short-subunit alcohol dehydrogenase family)
MKRGEGEDMTGKKNWRAGMPSEDDFPGPDVIRRLFDLSGKVALVTGAASGLGRQIALGLASFGADVAAADIDLPGAEATAQAVGEIAGTACAIQVDVSDWSRVEQMIQKVLEQYGRLDICFNVPGINIRKPVLELSPEEYSQVVDLNLKGVFHCSKAAGEVMVRQKKGKIINMGSIFGLCGGPLQSAYASSKGGLVQLTKVLALEWATDNVQVNALSPGYHMTFGPIAREYLETPPGEAMVAAILGRIPQGRVAHASEIIGPAVFLASDASDYVTGAVIVPDGGWTAQ